MKTIYMVNSADYHYFKECKSYDEVTRFIDEYVFVKEEHFTHGGIVIREYVNDVLMDTEVIDEYTCEEMNRF